MSKSTARFVGLLGVAVATGFAPPARAQEKTDAEQPYALVISGGVSLGSYQAGVTYAYLAELRRRREASGDKKPRLTITTGSSAGNVNAFLAAITWCAHDSSLLSPRQNMFWDSWINVDWSMLSPSDPDQGEYKKLFDRSLSTGPFAMINSGNLGRTWHDGDSVYTSEDGLFTRQAFRAGETYVGNMLKARAYDECLVKVGITVTPGRPQYPTAGGGAATQRAVVPLMVTRADPGERAVGSLKVRNMQWRLKKEDPQAPDDWDVASSDIGQSIALPTDGATPGANDAPIAIPTVMSLIKASSAFPIAFAPQPLDYCATKASTASFSVKNEMQQKCPLGLTLLHGRFIDGGLFDNVPLGMAMNLAKENGKDVERPTRYIYVDSDIRREDVRLSEPKNRAAGLSFMWEVLGHYIDEARTYELQKVALENDKASKKVTLLTSSRFFPVVGDLFVNSFGAFVHPAFRVHDYFVGVYDGIINVAQDLLARDRPDPPVAPAFPDWDHFKTVRDQLVKNDDAMRVFVTNLYRYESYWARRIPNPKAESPATPAVVRRENELRDACDWKPDPFPTGTPTTREDDNVVAVFKTLCTLDRTVRESSQSGSRSEIVDARAKAEDFFEVLAQVGPKPFVDDVSEWKYATFDRLVRRGIDIERSDRREVGKSDEAQKPPITNSPTRMFETTAVVARLALATVLERDHEVFDLDPSSVARISGGRWSVGRLFWHLFPYFVTYDWAQSSYLAGWEPKLRMFPPGIPQGLYIPVGLYGRGYVHPESSPEVVPGKERLRFHGMLATGIGWDPGERWLDDLQLTLTKSERAPWDHGQALDWWGLELTGHAIGGKVRLSVGMPRLLAGASEAGWRGHAEGFYVALGFGDLNGLLYWGAQSLWGRIWSSKCEEACDETLGGSQGL